MTNNFEIQKTIDQNVPGKMQFGILDFDIGAYLFFGI